MPHGALASLRGRPEPPHDGIRRMGRYNLSGALAASLSRTVSSFALATSCVTRLCSFTLRLTMPHGALASLRGRPEPPHDGIRRMGRYNLSGALAASLSRTVSSFALATSCVTRLCSFTLRLTMPHGALASLRGRPEPPHDGIRRMGRYNLSGALAASLSRTVSSFALATSCVTRLCSFTLRLTMPHGALASLRGRPEPPHDGIRRMGRYNLSGALAASLSRTVSSFALATSCVTRLCSFTLRLTMPHGALASLRGRPEPPHDGIRRMGRYNLSGAL